MSQKFRKSTGWGWLSSWAGIIWRLMHHHAWAGRTWGQEHLASPCALSSSQHGSSGTQTSVMVAFSGSVPAVKEKLHGLLWSNHGIKQGQVPQNVLVSASSPKDSREGESASTSLFFFSLCLVFLAARRLSLVVVRGCLFVVASRCRAWAGGLSSCPAACGIFPDQGLNLCPLPYEGRFLTTGPPEKSCLHLLIRER